MPSPTSGTPYTNITVSTSTTAVEALVKPNPVKWGGDLGTSASLTYSFPWANSNYATFSGLNGGSYTLKYENTATEHFGLNSTQQIAAEAAMAAWSAVANVTFTEVTDTASTVGDIRFAFSSNVGDWWGWAYYPASNPSAGDVWIAPKYASGNWTTGSYNFHSLIHELGHALGLSHPYDDPSTLDRSLTLMSYEDATGFDYIYQQGGSYYWDTLVPTTPMLYDIQAIQYLYGANYSYRAGDDTYTFDRSTRYFETIWDGGGKGMADVEVLIINSIEEAQ